MIRRWLPYPLLSLLLLLIWLLFNLSVAPGTIATGVVFAVLLAKVFGLLRPPKAHVRNYPLLVRLFVRVVFDIVRSNVVVARLILRREVRANSGFVAIPLTLTDHYGLAVLACIITSTPGTIWVSHDPSASILLIHVLDVGDEQAWIDSIKRRYEQPLQEIFQ